MFDRGIQKLIVSVLLIVGLPAGGLSQDASRGKGDVEERLRLIEDRLSQLEKRMDEALKPAAAETSIPPSVFEAGLAERFDALDQKLRILQRKRELEKDSARAQAQESPIIKAGRDGFRREIERLLSAPRK